MQKTDPEHPHPGNKQCRDLLDQLSEFVDGTLDKKLCDEIEAHLESCPNCTIVVDSLRKTIHLYQVTAQSEQMPEGVRERLYKHLHLEAYLKPPASKPSSSQKDH